MAYCPAHGRLDDVRLHDLRHSCTSVAVSGGASLQIIGALLGHANAATTQRYAHLQEYPVKAASESVGRQLAASLLPSIEGDVSKKKTAG